MAPSGTPRPLHRVHNLHLLSNSTVEPFGATGFSLCPPAWALLRESCHCHRVGDQMGFFSSTEEPPAPALYHDVGNRAQGSFIRKPTKGVGANLQNRPGPPSPMLKLTARGFAPNPRGRWVQRWGTFAPAWGLRVGPRARGATKAAYMASVFKRGVARLPGSRRGSYTRST